MHVCWTVLVSMANYFKTIYYTFEIPTGSASLNLIVAAAVYIVIVSAALTIAVPLNVVSLALVSLKPTLVGIVIVKVLWCPV